MTVLVLLCNCQLMDLYALILTSEHNKHGVFGLCEAFFYARLCSRGICTILPLWRKKRGHTGELDRLWWGYSLVEQHGVLVRNKYPEGSKLENQPMNIGMVWLSKNGILEIFGY